jgi:hypothetical protein
MNPLPARSLGEVRFSPALLAALACVGLGGCLGGEDESPRPTNGSADTPECPNGEEPLSAVYDLGENPKGAPSARDAVARFLGFRDSDLTADSFDRDGQGSSRADRASFTYSEGGSQLVRLYVERLERGWLVIAYEFCRGAL